MPTFKAKEVVDARQFMGTLESAEEMAVWCESQTSDYQFAEFVRPVGPLRSNRVPPAVLRICTVGDRHLLYAASWLVHKQETGEFEVRDHDEMFKKYDMV